MSPRWGRVVLFYALFTGALGCAPYFGVMLGDEGYGDGEVAAWLLCIPLGTMIVGPLVSYGADKVGRRIGVLRGATALHALALAMVAMASGLWVAPLLVLGAISRSPVPPIADAATLRWLGAESHRYGAIRAVGSVVFVFVVFLNGVVRERWPDAPFWAASVMVALAAVVSLGLPEVEDAPPAAEIVPHDRWALLKHPVLVPLYLTALFHGITLTTYDHLFTLRMERALQPGWASSSALALGVTVEVFVLAFGGYALRRVPPGWLLLASVASGLPRWLITGGTEHTGSIVAAQALHGLGFGAFWIAGVALCGRYAPPKLTATAQGMFLAAGFGASALIALGAATWGLGRYTPTTWFLGLTGIEAAALVLAIWTLVREGKAERG